jgi:sialic acid synthase SpsE/endonuclease IV
MLLNPNNYKFDEYLIREDASLDHVLKKIIIADGNTLFVVNLNKEIQGSITFGDIKRSVSLTLDRDQIANSKLKAIDIANKEFYYQYDVKIQNKTSHSVIPVIKKNTNKIVFLLINNIPQDSIDIGGNIITDHGRPILISEIGVNHDGNIDIAKNLIKDSKNAGADFVKFQHRNLQATYGFNLSTSSELSTESTINYLKKVNFSIEQLSDLFEYARSIGIEPLCTPFDLISLEEVMSLSPKVIKIASADLSNFPLLKSCALYGIPIIVSTGMHHEYEIINAINFLRSYTNKIITLHCISTYPAPEESLNLKYLNRLKSITSTLVGYSSHDSDIFSAPLAIANGACVIEKHITYDKNASGTDHKASILFDEMKALRMLMDKAYLMNGNGDKKELIQGEILNRSNLSKSLYLKKDVKKGDIINASHFQVLSPSIGIMPSDFNLIDNKKYKKNIKADSPVNFFDIQGFKSDFKISKNNTPKLGRWGVPVRFRDFKNAIKEFPNIGFFEFHLTSDDLNFKEFERLDILGNVGCKVHTPEVFDDNFILDLITEEKNISKKSLNYLIEVVSVAKKIREYSNKKITTHLVINAGGHTTHGFKKININKALKNLHNNFKSIDFGEIVPVVQTMPPFPFHLGGRRFHNLFVNSEDINLWKSISGLDVCLDISHTMLACNYNNISLVDFIKKIEGCFSYVHLSDAIGSDGEGMQIGEGEVDFKSLKNTFSVIKNLEYIPEIWQGHVNNFSGFKKALITLNNDHDW